MKPPTMKLSAYIVRHDSGFSPNPFGRVCTLACCKPIIRRNANEGDIIVGTGSSACGLEGRLIYAMLVKAVLPFDSYWQRYPSKRPSSRTPVKRLGDNIWHRDSSGKWCFEPGAIHDERNQSRDLSGHNALISDDFYYFGRDAIENPERFRCLIATTQGHVNSHDVLAIGGFWKWIKANSTKRGRIGLPSDFAKPTCGCDQVDDE